MLDDQVQIFGGTPGKEGAYLKDVYDPVSGRYFAPVLTDPGVKKLHESGITGKRIKVGILDTGLCSEHPWIKKTLIKAVDFTGEGSEDLNGHGTMVALLLLMEAPEVNIVNIKVLDSRGIGTRENFIKGINCAIEQKVNVLNISAGIYTKKLGIFECDGYCDICRAAENAVKNNIFICAAAGNEPDKTSCPARLAIARPDVKGILSVGAYDFDEMRVARYSGNCTILGPVGTYRFISVD